MEQRHRDLLRKNRIALAKDLEPKYLLGHLFQHGVISENDMERIKAEKTRTSQAEKLLDTLPRRGPKAFGVFWDTLYEIEGQRHLALALKTNIADPSTGKYILSTCYWFQFNSVVKARHT